MTEPVTVYFVGAGPGDPELITLKGHKLLKEADIVIFAGSLVKESSLSFCRSNAKLLNSASMVLEEIMEIMISAASHGERVVRLHSGDPSIYGALHEQTEILDKAGIPYKIVPGVCSAFASAAALKEELTMPEINQTVILTRKEGKTPVPPLQSLDLLAAHQATMCIFLSIGLIDDVVADLLKGYPSGTPVAVVHRASWDNEKIIRGTLEDISKKVKKADISRQAMIIVGKTLSHTEQIKSKLYDKAFSHGYRNAKDN